MLHFREGLLQICSILGSGGRKLKFIPQVENLYIFTAFLSENLQAKDQLSPGDAGMAFVLLPSLTSG